MSSYRQFVDLFKDHDNKLPAHDVGLDLLANSVYGFFNNGGARCYVTRAASPSQGDESGKEKAQQKAKQYLAEKILAAVTDLLKNHGRELASAEKKKLKDELQSKLPIVNSPSSLSPLQKALESWLKEHWKDIAANLTDDLKSLLKVWLQAQEQTHRDAIITDTICKTDIRKALAALEPHDDISIVAAPGMTDPSQWEDLISHCETFEPNRFAVLDAPNDADWAATPPKSRDLPQKSDYAAIYYPWVRVADAISGKEVAAPPSGHVAGVYARVDAQRGVFKAPANESVYGALDLQTYISSNQQKQLNDPLAINCIRRLNGGILIWGARTVQAQDTDPFKYVSTRRTFNYIRQSLESGMQWAVFEPNTPALWGQIVRNATSFLTKLWQSGGLFGSTAAEAFYVKCDEDTNPPDVRASGQVVTEVGVAISQPAEFVVFYLGLTTGSATPTS
ncbi:phage tail sheath family protein [Luteimonas salinilitoris]|uniref:Phage tail sheath family protein n=1 Tax=Luteimonas salinilitoris TaxID=3237697 RepID=A0ABV4HT94_9GAMM